MWDCGCGTVGVGADCGCGTVVWDGASVGALLDVRVDKMNGLMLDGGVFVEECNQGLREEWLEDTYDLAAEHVQVAEAEEANRRIQCRVEGGPPDAVAMGTACC